MGARTKKCPAREKAERAACFENMLVEGEPGSSSNPEAGLECRCAAVGEGGGRYIRLGRQIGGKLTKPQTPSPKGP